MPPACQQIRWHSLTVLCGLLVLSCASLAQLLLGRWWLIRLDVLFKVLLMWIKHTLEVISEVRELKRLNTPDALFFYTELEHPATIKRPLFPNFCTANINRGQRLRARDVAAGPPPRWLTGSRSVSLGTKRHLTNETQITKKTSVFHRGKNNGNVHTSNLCSIKKHLFVFWLNIRKTNMSDFILGLGG